MVNIAFRRFINHWQQLHFTPDIAAYPLIDNIAFK